MMMMTADEEEYTNLSLSVSCCFLFIYSSPSPSISHLSASLPSLYSYSNPFAIFISIDPDPAIKLSREEAQQREILYNNPTRNGSGNADGMQENLAALSLGHGTNPGDDMNPSNGDGEYSPTHRFSPQDLRRQSQVQLVAMLKEKLSLHLAQMSSKEDFEIQSLLNQKDILKRKCPPSCPALATPGVSIT